MTTPQFSSVEEFAEWAERQAEAWRARYGLAPEDHVSDALIDIMLDDEGYPALADMPAEPQGMMARQSGFVPGTPQTEIEQHRHRRGNAMHLIGHAILQHEGGHCNDCVTWGSR